MTQQDDPGPCRFRTSLLPSPPTLYLVIFLCVRVFCCLLLLLLLFIFLGACVCVCVCDEMSLQIVYFFPSVVFSEPAGNGSDYGMWAMNTAVYTALVLVVNLKLAIELT